MPARKRRPPPAARSKGARGPLYHCAELENAWAIESEGFRSFPKTFDEFSHLYPNIVDWFTPAERARVASTADYDQKRVVAWGIFRKRFGHGTLIHLAATPLWEYGDACYQVTLPKGALITPFVGAQDGFLAWIPKSPIPKKCLRRLTGE